MASVIYVVDSSSLIDLARFTPMDVYPTVWDRLESLVDERRLMAPVQVLYEIRSGSDALVSWARAHGEMFRPVDRAVMLTAQQILGEYPSLAKRRDRNDADAFIIGLAISVMKPEQRRLTPSKAVVVTEEKLKGDRVVIPFVCQNYDLESLSCLGMFRAEGWQF